MKVTFLRKSVNFAKSAGDFRNAALAEKLLLPTHLMKSNKVAPYLTPENIFLVFGGFLFLWLRLNHLDIVLERDEGEYAYAAQEILRGKLPYQDFYNMKLPGTYYLYALTFHFLGDSILSIKILLLFVNCISAFFLFQFTRVWYNKNIAKLTTGIFLILCVSFSSQGWTANCEHFVVVFAMMGIYFSTKYIQKGNLIHLVLAGVLLACANICKQHGVFFGFFIALQLLFRNNDFKISYLFKAKFIKELFFYALGFIIPVSILLTYFFKKNIFEAFNFFTFSYASAYANIQSPFQDIWHFRPIFWDTPVFWILIFSMVYNAIKRKSFFIQHEKVFTLFFCSFAATSVGWYYRAHYFQLCFPAVAIMAAFMISNISSLWKFKYVNTFSILALSCFTILVSQFKYFFIHTSEEITFDMYFTDPFNERKLIADTLNERFKNHNYKIGMIGNEPEILFYTKKESGSGFLYLFPLIEKHKYAELFTRKFISELETSKPEIFLYFTDYIDLNPENPKTSRQITDFYNRFKQNYIPIGRMDSIGDNKVQLNWRTNEKSTINVDSAFYGAIYLRKDLYEW